MTKSEVQNKCTHYFWTWLFISEVAIDKHHLWKDPLWAHLPLALPVVNPWCPHLVREKLYVRCGFLHIWSYCLERKFALEDNPKYLFSKISGLCSLRLAVEQFSSSCSVRLADSELEKIKMSKDLPWIICWNFNLLTAWMTPFFLFFIFSDYLSVSDMRVGRCKQYYIICQSQY